MPYYDQSKCTQTEDFIDTIDVLQSLIDCYNVIHPIKFLGDFNVQLPRKNPSYPTWYDRGKAFNSHCLILHNCMLANDLIPADMVHNTNSFTYFCHKINVYTWIDHVLCAEFDTDSITSCRRIYLILSQKMSAIIYQYVHRLLFPPQVTILSPLMSPIIVTILIIIHLLIGIITIVMSCTKLA